MIYELLDKLEAKHPTIYFFVMLLIFFLGCTAIAALAIFAKYIASII